MWAAERDHIAGLQITRGLAAHAHAGRRAGGDEVAGQQGHVVAEIGDEVGHAENHVARVAGLHALTVHVEPEVDVLRVGDLVAADQPRADRAEGVAAFAQIPLAALFELIGALGHVVDQAIPGHVFERIGLAHKARLAPDDHAEFDFPIELVRAGRAQHRIVRAADAGRPLVEHNGRGRDGHARLVGMVAVVQADGDELADADEGHAQPRLAAHQRQTFSVDAAQRLRSAEHAGVDLVDDAAEAAQAALRVDQAGLLLAVAAVADELHNELLQRRWYWVLPNNCSRAVASISAGRTSVSTCTPRCTAGRAAMVSNQRLACANSAQSMP